MRHRKTYFKRRGTVLFRLFVTITVVCVCMCLADARLRPQIRSMAAVKASALAEQAVNDAVLSALSEKNYGSLVTVEKNSEGQVTAVQTDVLKINMIKADISKKTASVLSGTKREIAIPIGSLTGLDILSGRGPSIKIKVSLSGFSESRVESTFTGEGINQTVHRLVLKVNSSVYISLPDSKETKNLTYEVCIAETVIVGYVPSFYANTN